MHFLYFLIRGFLPGLHPLVTGFREALTVCKGVDAPSFVWASEVFPTTLRAKGVSLAVFAYFVGTITFSTPAPVALNSM